MKKIIAIAVATAFAASSFGALAQDKKDVKSGGDAAKTADKNAVTTGGGKPKRDEKGGAKVPKPKHQGKRKTEEQRTDKK